MKAEEAVEVKGGRVVVERTELDLNGADEDNRSDEDKEGRARETIQELLRRRPLQKTREHD